MGRANTMPRNCTSNPLPEYPAASLISDSSEQVHGKTTQENSSHGVTGGVWPNNQSFTCSTGSTSR
jgi:hypothetical protein